MFQYQNMLFDHIINYYPRSGQKSHSIVVSPRLHLQSTDSMVDLIARALYTNKNMSEKIE